LLSPSKRRRLPRRRIAMGRNVRSAPLTSSHMVVVDRVVAHYVTGDTVPESEEM